MKKLVKIMVCFGLPVAVFGFVIAVILGGTNPDSVFCHYVIYRQTNGTYQVWWQNRSNELELSGVTYAQAKEYQREQCASLRARMWGAPKGEKVR